MRYILKFFGGRTLIATDHIDQVHQLCANLFEGKMVLIDVKEQRYFIGKAKAIYFYASDQTRNFLNWKPMI